MIDMTRALVFAPHHDDAEFGIGGLLARTTQRGRLQPEGYERPRVVVMAYGDYQSGDRTVLGAERSRESEQALAMLGADLIESRTFIENRAFHAEYGDVVRVMEEYILAVQPSAVFGPLPSFNQDHRLVHDCLVTAMRPQRWTRTSGFLYEYPGTSVADTPAHGRIDIGLTVEEMNLKERVLKAHRTQFGADVDGMVTPSGARLMMEWRGLDMHEPGAERVYLMRGSM